MKKNFEFNIVKIAVPYNFGEIKKVKGEYKNILGHHCGVNYDIDTDWGTGGDYKTFTVTHLETGFSIAEDLSYEYAIKQATERLEKYKDEIDKRFNKAKRLLKKCNIEYPINDVKNIKQCQHTHKNIV